MDADRIRITRWGWVALLGIPLLLVLLILQLRKIDEQRRQEQFRILHAFLLRPEHAEALLPWIERFDPADTAAIRGIGHVLRKMTTGGSCIDQAEVIVKKDGLYYTISMYSTYNQHSGVEGRLLLNDPLEQALDSLPSGVQLPPDRIYLLAGGTAILRSGLRSKNAMLLVSSWREQHDWND